MNLFKIQCVWYLQELKYRFPYLFYIKLVYEGI